MQVGIITNQKPCHNGGDSVWSIVFCILTTACGIVILDKILKDSGKEVIMLRECFLKGEVYELVHQRTSKRRSLCFIGNVLSEPFKQRDFSVLSGLSGEYIYILIGYVDHRLVEDKVKIALCLLIPQVRDKVFGIKPRNIGIHRVEQVLTFIFRQLRISDLPLFSLCDTLIELLDFIAEFIIQVLIQEYLSNDFILVSVIAHTIGLASRFQ